MTRKPHDFKLWIACQKAIGATHLFLAVEESPDVVQACKKPEFHNFVTLKPVAPSHNPYDTVIDRQERHIAWALDMCKKMQIDWLFHLDDDELLHFESSWESIAAKIPTHVDCLVINNVEAVPDDSTADFSCIRRFAVVQDAFLSYVNGKSAGRVGRAEQCGPHRFTGEEYLVSLEDAMILHFESCPFRYAMHRIQQPMDS